MELLSRAGGRMGDKGHNILLGKSLPCYVQVNLIRDLGIQALKLLFLIDW